MEEKEKGMEVRKEGKGSERLWRENERGRGSETDRRFREGRGQGES